MATLGATHNYAVFHAHHRYYEQAIGLGGLGILGAPADDGFIWQFCDGSDVEFCNGEIVQFNDRNQFKFCDGTTLQFCDGSVVAY